MPEAVSVPKVAVDVLRTAISKEYAEVARNPQKGFHFHTGRSLARVLGYSDALVDSVPERAVASFAGTGNPFSLGDVEQGERVVDVGSGAGFDSLVAARLVGAAGAVVGIDMTAEMLRKARAAAVEAGTDQVEFREGCVEFLPVEDEWADVMISNSVVNLCPDKVGVFREMYRVLKPGGRIQIGDILVQKPVPDAAKEEIDLWTG